MSWLGSVTPMGSQTTSQSWVALSDSASLVSIWPFSFTSTPTLRQAAARYSAAAWVPAPLVVA